MFDTVQQIITKAPVASSGKDNTPRSDNAFRGKVICGYCGGKMQRKKNSGSANWYFFTCISKNRLGADHCTGMYIRELEIMNAVLDEVKRVVQTNEAVALIYRDEMALLKAQTAKLESNIQKSMKIGRGHYENFVNGITGHDERDFE